MDKRTEILLMGAAQTESLRPQGEPRDSYSPAFVCYTLATVRGTERRPTRNVFKTGFSIVSNLCPGFPEQGDRAALVLKTGVRRDISSGRKSLISPGAGVIQR